MPLSARAPVCAAAVVANYAIGHRWHFLEWAFGSASFVPRQRPTLAATNASAKVGNKKEQEEMNNGKKGITKARVVFAILLLGVIVAVAVTGYRYYRSNRWVTVQEGPDDWVLVDGELAQKNSAPCPKMILKQGKAKFLPGTTDKSQVLLGYKMTVGSEMGKAERDASKYAPYLYQVRFRFTLADKDGFPLQVVEGPKDYEILEISKPRDYQNVCTTPIGDRTADRTDRVYITYVLSATGPHPQ